MKKKTKNKYIKKLNPDKYPKTRKAICKGQKRENASRKKNNYYRIEGDINEGYLSGNISRICKPFTGKGGEKFIETTISVPRFSDNVDIIPVVFTEEMYKLYQPKLTNGRVTLIGNIRSKDRVENGKNVSFQYFQPNSLDFDEDKYKQRNNSLHLCGTICRKPIIKKLDLSDICYLKIAVNKPELDNYIHVYSRVKSKNEDVIRSLKIGDRIDILGRIQSRQFHESEFEIRTINEVSIAQINNVEYKGINTKITFEKEKE